MRGRQEWYYKPEESYAVEDGIQSALEEEQEHKKILQIKEELRKGKKKEVRENRMGYKCADGSWKEKK